MCLGRGNDHFDAMNGIAIVRIVIGARLRINAVQVMNTLALTNGKCRIFELHFQNSCGQTIVFPITVRLLFYAREYTVGLCFDAMPFQNSARTDSSDAVYRIYVVYGQNQYIRYLASVQVVMVVVNTCCVQILTMPYGRSITRVATAEFGRALGLYYMKGQYDN